MISRAQLWITMLLALVAVAAAAGRASGGTQTYQVAASADDTTASSSENCTTCGNFYVPYTTGDRRAFMRWAVRVPKGATVTSAYIYLKFDGQGSTSSSVARIALVDRDDCPSFSTDPFSWAVADYADWTVGDVTPIGGWTKSDNLAPVVQGFVDRPGYEYGNYLGVRAINASGSWKRALTWNSGDHSAAPMLEVNWTGGEVPVELWMADPELRLGQRVYCQLDNVEPTDRLRATLDGTPVFEKLGDLQPEEVLVVDYRSLTAGPHVLRVEVRDSGDALRGGAERTWIQVRDGLPHVGIDENNAICVEGEPFFPVTPWGVEGTGVASWMPYVNALNHQGWNAARTIAGWTAALDNAQSYGLKILGPLRGNYWPNGDTSNIVEDPPGSGNWIHYTEVDIDQLGSYVSATRDHPGVFMWGWKDEPDLGGTDQYIPATEVRRWTDKCHELDGHHPHAVNIVGYNFTGSPPYPNYGNNRAASYCFLYSDQWNAAMGTNQPFDKKTVCTDVISMDYYPYEYATKYAYVSLEDCMLALDRLREWNYNLLPVMTWIETCDIHNPADGYTWTPAPTPTQLRNLAWLSVIHDAKGIQWFHYFEPTPPENYAVMQTFLDQITALTPVVLGPEDVETTVTDTEQGGGRVDVMVREHEGLVYVFAADVLGLAETVRFDVEGLAAGTEVEVYDEGRTITASAGYFEDSFDSLSVHIYVLPEVPPPGVSQWHVLATHGPSELAVPAAEGYVHPEVQGVSRLRVGFSTAIDPATLSASSFSIVGAMGGDLSAMISSVQAAPDNMSVTLSLENALPDADRYTVEVLDTLKDEGGQAYGDTVRHLAALAGDADGSGQVAPIDFLAVRAQAGTALSPATARYDLDSSGAISGADMLEARNRLGRALP